MRVLIAMDSMKGSLDAKSCCNAIARGFGESTETVCVPLSDGGEGWCDCMESICGGRRVEVSTLHAYGNPMQGYYLSLENMSCAVVETAVASGIIGMKEKNPERASTYGTGILLRAALESGAKTVILGLGGSATTDGGMGAMQALGARFYDASGALLGGTGADLQKIDRMDCSDLHPALKTATLILACDVDAVFDGENGAAHVFGPQKGADAEMVARLDAGLGRMKCAILQECGYDLNGVRGAGAAGGLCGGLLGISQAEIRSGFSVLCEVGGFESLVKTCDLVITGEGKTDRQTLMGKVPYRVGQLAKKHKVPALLLSGDVRPEAEQLKQHGFLKLYRLMEEGMCAEYAMAHAEELAEARAREIAREWE